MEKERELQGNRSLSPSWLLLTAFIPIPTCPAKYSSHHNWYRCQSTLNECTSLLAPGVLFYIVTGTGFERHRRQILSLLLEAQQQHHYIIIHFCISFTFLTSSATFVCIPTWVLWNQFTSHLSGSHVASASNHSWNLQGCSVPVIPIPVKFIYTENSNALCTFTNMIIDKIKFNCV